MASPDGLIRTRRESGIARQAGHLGYPIMDLGVLFIVVNSLVFGNVRRTADKLIAAAMAAMVVADFAYGVQILHGTYSTGNPIDAGWLIRYVLLGVAALHPSMATVPTRSPEALHRRRWTDPAADGHHPDRVDLARHRQPGDLLGVDGARRRLVTAAARAPDGHRRAARRGRTPRCSCDQQPADVLARPR
jgi:hypothetical protein